MTNVQFNIFRKGKFFRIKYFITTFIAVFVFSSCYSQRYLLLDRIGSRHRIEIYPGETLRFQLKGEDHFNEAVINFLQDSLIILDVGVINIRDIHAIAKDRTSPSGIVAASRLLMIAGLGIIFIDQFNTVIIAGDPPNINPGIMIAGGSLVVIHYLIQLAQRRKYVIKGNRRLRIVDLGFETD
ncbi:hypothetical protein BH23BAC1_BH23BAC1_04010 [soil metagenome]